MNYFSDEIDSRRRLMLKYSVLAAGGIYSLTLANRVLAVWPASLFEHQAPDSLLDELTEGKGISETEQISITVPKVVENAAILPVGVSSTLENVESISVILTANANPLAGTFKFTKQSKPLVSTRVKLESAGEVVAVVNAGGRFYAQRQHVDVKAFACKPIKPEPAKQPAKG